MPYPSVGMDSFLRYSMPIRLRFLSRFQRVNTNIVNGIRNILNLHYSELKRNYVGFTLAELLIVLLIIGEIATFSIPKIIMAQRKGASNTAAHEAAGMVATAYQLYLQNSSSATSSTTPGALTQYMNYVSVPTSGTLDDVVTQNSVYTCNSGVTCLKLHSGGTLFYNTSNFSGTNTTNFIQFYLDPDGVRGSSGSADGSSKSLAIVLYYNGRVTTWGNMAANSVNSSGTYSSGSYDPSWFQW